MFRVCILNFNLQASKEAKYSGGYRPNVNEHAQYPGRVPDRWQDGKFAQKDPEHKREQFRPQKFDLPRFSEPEPKRSRSGNRFSRSPRRDRSPGTERIRRRSPSPLSPRRSWALEKRRSPEMREPPPPPIWPGQEENTTFQHTSRNFPERDLEKTSPVWQKRTVPDHDRDEFIRQRNADRERFEEEMRRRQTVHKWKPVPQESLKGSRYVEEDRREDKFAKKGFEERRDYREEDFEMKDVPRKKEVFAGRIEEKKKEILKKQEELQKEIDEVYKRAVDFTKRATLHRKGESKKGTSYDPFRDDDSNGDDGEYGHSRSNDAKDYDRSHEDSSVQKNMATIPNKKKRAQEQIAEKIMSKHGSHLPQELKLRVMPELQISVGKILNKFFGNEDVSFIEMVIKFNSSHSDADEEAIFDAVMSSFPSQYRRPKRPAQGENGYMDFYRRFYCSADIFRPVSHFYVLPLF